MKKPMFFLAPVIVGLSMTAVAAAGQPMKPLGPPPPSPIPANYVATSGCVPTMGVHYIDPKTFPHSPIYGTYQGKPVFTELMITPKEFAAGKSWYDVLHPLPGYAIDHVDIGYLPHGHPGMTFAHYDVHAYYVSHATHMKFCPGKMGM